MVMAKKAPGPMKQKKKILTLQTFSQLDDNIINDSL